MTEKKSEGFILCSTSKMTVSFNSLFFVLGAISGTLEHDDHRTSQKNDEKDVARYFCQSYEPVISVAQSMNLWNSFSFPKNNRR